MPNARRVHPISNTPPKREGPAAVQLHLAPALAVEEGGLVGGHRLCQLLDHDPLLRGHTPRAREGATDPIVRKGQWARVRARVRGLGER